MLQEELYHMHFNKNPVYLQLFKLYLACFKRFPAPELIFKRYPNVNLKYNFLFTKTSQEICYVSNYRLVFKINSREKYFNKDYL